MADALYDMIAAGVPHRIAEVCIDGLNPTDLNLIWGQTTKLPLKAIDELLKRFVHDIHTESGAAARLSVCLSLRALRVGIIDLGSTPIMLQIPEHDLTSPVFHFREKHHLGNMANACRVLIKETAGSIATAISYGSVDVRGGKPSAMLVRAGKILCLEDRLWDVEGGAEFAASAIDVAHSAGRKIVLLCKDPDCVFRNRFSIRKLTDNRINYVMGEATTALLLHDLQRLDSLVPRLKSLSTGAVLWRHSIPPLVLEGAVISPTVDHEMTDEITFWNAILPDRMATLARSGSILNPVDHPIFLQECARD